MTRSVFLLFLLVNFVSIDCTTPIGTIYNATYVSSDITSVITYNSSCLECLCNAFFSNVLSSYVGLNCYTTNQTCVLFANFTSPATLKINLDSTFLFIQRPPLLTTTPVLAITSVVPATTVTPSQTTSSPCASLQWNSTGIIFAAYGSGSNQVAQPFDIFIPAGSDVLYIADWGNNRIQQWILGATNATTIAGGQGVGSNATQLRGPCALYVDRNKNLFVSDTYNFRAQVFVNGSLFGRTIAGNGTQGAANTLLGISIGGIGVDLANNVYISELDNNRITKWAPNATYGTLAAGNGTQGDSPSQLHTPTGLYVDPTTGTLYIASQAAHCIVKWLPGASNGTTIAGTCGTAGTNASLLTTPESVTFDKYGNMYVADLSNSGRISMFCPNSLIGTPIITSGLDNPISIALDRNLSLYVSDWANKRIVKYSLL